MNSILQYDRSVCFLCMRHVGTECHHVFEGTANRKKSEEDGMKIYICRTCHNWLHRNPGAMTPIKQRAQQVWEEKYGSRDDFIRRYGWDYIEGGHRT